MMELSLQNCIVSVTVINVSLVRGISRKSQIEDKRLFSAAVALTIYEHFLPGCLKYAAGH